jgi:predicted phage tail protein
VSEKAQLRALANLGDETTDGGKAGFNRLNGQSALCADALASAGTAAVERAGGCGTQIVLGLSGILHGLCKLLPTNRARSRHYGILAGVHYRSRLR